jgi:hypothetical protein
VIEHATAGVRVEITPTADVIKDADSNSYALMQHVLHKQTVSNYAADELIK